jgi:hypothetical protein
MSNYPFAAFTHEMQQVRKPFVGPKVALQT